MWWAFFRKDCIPRLQESGSKCEDAKNNINKKETKIRSFANYIKIIHTLCHLTLSLQLPFDYINKSIYLMIIDVFQYSKQLLLTIDIGPENEHTFTCLELSNTCEISFLKSCKSGKY